MVGAIDESCSGNVVNDSRQTTALSGDSLDGGWREDRERTPRELQMVFNVRTDFLRKQGPVPVADNDALFKWLELHKAELINEVRQANETEDVRVFGVHVEVEQQADVVEEGVGGQVHLVKYDYGSDFLVFV